MAAASEHPPPALPGVLGITVTHLTAGRVEAVLIVQAFRLAPTGHLRAGAVVSPADTACCYGCRGPTTLCRRHASAP